MNLKISEIIVKLKGHLHCLARMSTNFHEFFTFGNNLRFLPKFPFKCSKNPLSRTLYDVYDDVPDYSRLKQEIHTMSINSWVLETFFSVIQKNWRNQRFFRLLIFEQLNYWVNQFTTLQIKTQTDQNDMISKLTSKSP